MFNFESVQIGPYTIATLNTGDGTFYSVGFYPVWISSEVSNGTNSTRFDYLDWGDM